MIDSAIARHEIIDADAEAKLNSEETKTIPTNKLSASVFKIV